MIFVQLTTLPQMHVNQGITATRLQEFATLVNVLEKMKKQLVNILKFATHFQDCVSKPPALMMRIALQMYVLKVNVSFAQMMAQEMQLATILLLRAVHRVFAITLVLCRQIATLEYAH